MRGIHLPHFRVKLDTTRDDDCDAAVGFLLSIQCEAYQLLGEVTVEEGVVSATFTTEREIDVLNISGWVKYQFGMHSRMCPSVQVLQPA